MLTLFLAAALALPVPASPPIPVSAPVYGAAPFTRSGVRVASSGSIALAVWNDDRNGSTEVTASRVNADGMPLDPTGIVIREASEVRDVFWNGTSFAVVTGPRNYSPPSESFVSTVTPEGEVSEGKVLAPIGKQYAARSGDGADAHFLFLPSDPSASTFAASNGSGFLELRAVSPDPYVAYVLDRDGKVLQSNDTLLPPAFKGAALIADRRGGYLFFGRAVDELVVVPLDEHGVLSGPPQLIQYGDSFDWRVTVTPTNDGFVATWFDWEGHGYLSRNGGAPVMMTDCHCVGRDTAYDPVNDLLFASYADDVFVRKGNATPVAVTQATRRQTNAAIAGGTSGFLVGWTEYDGANATLYVRRFASDATPLGEAQVVDMTDGAVSIISSGDAYVVMWGGHARRMDARTGMWSDSQPFPVPAAVQAIASNGNEYLAVWEECLNDCGIFSWPYFGPRRIVAMRLNADGTQRDAVPIVLDPAATDNARLAVAWNGKTYLVTWSNNGGIRGAYVGSDGAVHDLGAISRNDPGMKAMKIVVHAAEFLILTTDSFGYGYWGPGDILRLTLLDGSRTTIATRPSDAFGPIDGASDGARLMLVYDRVDPQAGRVGRVVLDPRVFPTRSRAVR